MGVSTVYYGAGTRGLQVFSMLPNKGTLGRVKAPVRLKGASIDVAPSLTYEPHSKWMTSYPNLTGDFPLLIRGKPAPRSRPRGGAERGKYLLSVGYRKIKALNHTLPASCWTLIVRARMSGVSEISEDLTNYGSSCHPEALPKAGKR